MSSTLAAFLSPPRAACSKCEKNAVSNERSNVCDECAAKSSDNKDAATSKDATKGNKEDSSDAAKAAPAAKTQAQRVAERQKKRGSRHGTLFEASTIDLERRRRLWQQVYTLEPLQLASITLAPAPIGVAMRDLRFVVAKVRRRALAHSAAPCSLARSTRVRC